MGKKKQKEAKKANPADKAKKAAGEPKSGHDGHGERVTDPTADAFEFEVFPKRTIDLDKVDLSIEAQDEDQADEEIEKLQQRMLELQVAAFLEKRSAVFVFEGWDAAGKGGAIRRLTNRLDPRGYKVWPIGAPRESEAAHNYLWRFAVRMPERGEIAIFDRSWYGRVLVERIEGFCPKAAWNRAFDEINAFERTLTAEGVAMAKFWIHIDKKTQLKRFKAREKDPVKQYKIGEEDWRNREKWAQYHDAAQDMFDRTHRPDAPWYVIPGNHKRYARVAILRRCVEVMERLVG